MTDKLSALALLVISGVIYLAAGSLPQPVYESLGPGFFPKILSLCLAGLSLWLLVQAILAGRAKPAANGDRAASRNMRLEPGTVRMLACGAPTLVYVLILGPLGFVPATAIFLLSIMIYLSKRKLRETLLIAVISCAYLALVYFSFTHLLRIFLP